MQIGFVTTSSASSKWLRRLHAIGRDVKQYSCAAVARGTPALWVVAIEDASVLHARRSWLHNVSAPLLLITPHLALAYAQRNAICHLSIICHPSRAAVFLEDMLLMTVSGAGGPAVFGPFRPRVFDQTYQILIRQ